MSDPNDSFQQIVTLVEPGARLVRHWSLDGGISCTMTGLEIERPSGERHKLVVRQVGKWSFENYPESVHNERALLLHLGDHGIPVARPRYADTSNTLLERPFLVLDYVEGSTDLTTADRIGRATKMADQLAEIHLLDPVDPVFAFMKPSKVNIRPENQPPDEDLQETKIHLYLSKLFPEVEENPYSFRHGDFWPGNVLWKDGELAAVIDWEETSIGDPLFDVSLTRLDVLWAYGEPAMHAFTERYQSRRHINYDFLPFWDLRISLRPMKNISNWASSFPPMGRPDVTAASMTAGHRWFVDQAIARSSRR